MPPDVVEAVIRSAGLDARERGRLEELAEGERARVLDLLATGDRICQAEARRRLAPPRVETPMPSSTADLLARIQERPTFPALAAAALASDLGDQKSHRWFHRIAQETWSGERPVSALVRAFEKAMGPDVRCRGAMFTSVVKGEAPR